MKKKIMALVLAAALAISAMSMLAVQAAGIEVTVDGAEFTVTVSGETDELDWVGIYKEGATIRRGRRHRYVAYLVVYQRYYKNG